MQRRWAERKFFIDNLLVRIHDIIVMIKWTGLAPWEFEFTFPGSLTSTILAGVDECRGAGQARRYGRRLLFVFTLVTGPRRSLNLKLSDTRVYEPQIRARLGTTSLFCEVVVLKPQRQKQESMSAEALGKQDGTAGKLKVGDGNAAVQVATIWSDLFAIDLIYFDLIRASIYICAKQFGEPWLVSVSKLTDSYRCFANGTKHPLLWKFKVTRISQKSICVLKHAENRATSSDTLGLSYSTLFARTDNRLRALRERSVLATVTCDPTHPSRERGHQREGI